MVSGSCNHRQRPSRSRLSCGRRDPGLVKPALPDRDIGQVVDDTGAGEILAGVYLALRARGLAEDQALGYAVRAASSSVTEFGVDGPHLTRELTAIRDEG